MLVSCNNTPFLHTGLVHVPMTLRAPSLSCTSGAADAAMHVIHAGVEAADAGWCGGGGCSPDMGDYSPPTEGGQHRAAAPAALGRPTATGRSLSDGTAAHLPSYSQLADTRAPAVGVGAGGAGALRTAPVGMTAHCCGGGSGFDAAPLVSVCVCVCVCVCVRERERAYVCACVCICVQLHCS